MRLLTILLLAGFCSTAAAAPPDSVGTKVKNGKRYVVHRTEQGEGLYRIAENYGVSMKAIRKANPNTDLNTLVVNQLVLIPRGAVSAQRASATSLKPGQGGEEKSGEPAKKAQPQYHVVEQGENLYRISKAYGVMVTQIKKWNEMQSSALDIGQKIIVGYSEQAASGNSESARQPAAEPPSEKSGEAPDDQAKDSSQSSKGAQKASAPVMGSMDSGQQEVDDNSRKNTVVDRGIGGWIDNGALNGNKALALHNSAPIGTIAQVRNKINGKTVFVKVVGRIPANHKHKDYDILISKPAADILEVYDKKFRVEVEYSVSDAYSER